MNKTIASAVTKNKLCTFTVDRPGDTIINSSSSPLTLSHHGHRKSVILLPHTMQATRKQQKYKIKYNESLRRRCEISTHEWSVRIRAAYENHARRKNKNADYNFQQAITRWQCPMMSLVCLLCEICCDMDRIYKYKSTINVYMLVDRLASLVGPKWYRMAFSVFFYVFKIIRKKKGRLHDWCQCQVFA